MIIMKPIQYSLGIFRLMNLPHLYKDAINYIKELMSRTPSYTSTD